MPRLQTPQVLTSPDIMGEQYSHPAFGLIQMNIVSGGNPTLFGSDIGHNQRVSIKINTANLRRSLGRDWAFADKTLVEFEMSHAQFAQFITSTGQGAGTPVTLNFIRGEGEIPGIQNLASKHEIHRNEIEQTAKEALDKLSAEIRDLKVKLMDGKVGKKDLQGAIHNMECAIENAPKDLAYAVSSAQTALEKATSDARIEVESFVQMMAQRIGMESIANGMPVSLGTQESKQ